MNNNVEDDLIKLCDDYINGVDDSLDKKSEEAIKLEKKRVKKELRQISRDNKQRIFRMKMAKFTIMLSKLTAETDANITFNIQSQDKAVVLESLKNEINRIILEFKKDKNYINEIRRLYDFVKKAAPEELMDITWLINSVLAKELHLEQRTDSEFEKYSYAVKGYNYIPANYVYDETKDHNEEINCRLEMVKNSEYAKNKLKNPNSF